MVYKVVLQEVLKEDCYPIEGLMYELGQMSSLADRISFLKALIKDMNAGIIKMLIDDRFYNEKHPTQIWQPKEGRLTQRELWYSHLQDQYSELRKFCLYKAPALIKSYARIINENAELKKASSNESAVIEHFSPDERPIDLVEAAEILKVQHKTMYDYNYKGILKPFTIGGKKKYYRMADLVAHMDRVKGR